METVPKGRRPINSAAFLKIAKAGKKEVVVDKKEWKLATPPGAYILRKYLRAEYEVHSIIGGGWLVKRV